MVLTLTPSATRDLRAALRPLDELGRQNRSVTKTVAGIFADAEGSYEMAGYRFNGPVAEHEPIRLGFFAGLHGDEPAGVTALVTFLQALVNEPSRAKGYEVWVFPVCNPTGYEDGTRLNRAGKDLNREFWRGSSEPEVQALEAELTRRGFHGMLTLHEDDTCEGIYGYAHGRGLNEALLKPALRAAERMLPRDARGHIDGFEATEGVIRDCFTGVLAAPPAQQPQPFDIIFETPGRAPFEAQVQAAVAALESVLAEYRAFIAYGGEL